MRLLFLALLALGCAADLVPLPDASPPADAGPCGGACGAGTVCQAGACVAVDAGAPEDRPAVVDLGAEDAGSDAGAMDTPQVVDAGGAVDTDPRQSETCRAITQVCDGRTVNVQTGERDGGLGQTFHCGACGVTCAAGSFCVSCVCER